MRRKQMLASVVLFIVLAVPLQGYDGTITAAGGYQPPPNVTVYWRTFSGGDILRKLNRNIPWSGANPDATGYLGRYAEGKDDVLGRWIASQGVETQGGMAFLSLRALFRDAGITRDPSLREVLDFGIVHGGQRQLGCADFTRLVGRSDPDCKELVVDGGLRPQPVVPTGCCKKNLPCVIDDRRSPGTVWSEAVRTPQGGRKGCFMIQPAKVVDTPPVDTPPVDTPPVDTPPVDTPPVDTPVNLNAAKCWLLKVVGDQVTATSAPCQPGQ